MCILLFCVNDILFKENYISSPSIQNTGQSALIGPAGLGRWSGPTTQFIQRPLLAVSDQFNASFNLPMGPYIFFFPFLLLFFPYALSFSSFSFFSPSFSLFLFSSSSSFFLFPYLLQFLPFLSAFPFFLSFSHFFLFQYN